MDMLAPMGSPERTSMEKGSFVRALFLRFFGSV
jgi:hypothetical protein